MNDRNQRMCTQDVWALVTGCSGGIGSAVCGQLRRVGLFFVGVDRILNSAVQSDISIEMHVGLNSDNSKLHSVLSQRGCPSVVVICSGSYNRKDVLSYTPDNVFDVVDDNFFASIIVLSDVLKEYLRSSRTCCRVIVVTSQAGVTGGYDPVYAASKAACTAFVKSLAREYSSKGFIINCVSPGPTDTSMAVHAMPTERVRYYERIIPRQRLAKAKEVAEVIVFLAISEQSIITGTTIDIDGGLVRR